MGWGSSLWDRIDRVEKLDLILHCDPKETLPSPSTPRFFLFGVSFVGLG